MKKQFITVAVPISRNTTSDDNLNKNPFLRESNFEESRNSDQALKKMLRSMDEIKQDNVKMRNYQQRSKSRKHNFSPDKVITINRKSSRSPISPERKSGPLQCQSPPRVMQSQSPPRVLVSQHLDQMKVTQKAVEAAMSLKKMPQVKFKKNQKVGQMSTHLHMKGTQPSRKRSRNTTHSPSTSVTHQYGGVNLVLPISQHVDQQPTHEQITLMEISDVLSLKIDRIQNQIATMNANKTFTNQSEHNTQSELQKCKDELLQKSQDYENLKIKYLAEAQQWQIDRGMLSRMQIEINKLARKNQELQKDPRYKSRNSQDISDAPARPVLAPRNVSPNKDVPIMTVQLLAGKDDLIQQLSHKLNESTKIIKQQLVQMVAFKNQSQDPKLHSLLEQKDKQIASLSARIIELEIKKQTQDQSVNQQQLAALRAQYQLMLAEQASQFTLEIVKLGNDSASMQLLKKEFEDQTQTLQLNHQQETSNLQQQLDQALFELALNQTSNQPDIQQLQQQMDDLQEENQNLIEQLQANSDQNSLEAQNAELADELEQRKFYYQNMQAEFNRRIAEMASAHEIEILKLTVDNKAWELLRSQLKSTLEELSKLKGQSSANLEPYIKSLRQEYDVRVSKEAASYQLELSYLVAAHKNEMLSSSDNFIARINLIEQDNASLRSKISNTVEKKMHVAIQQSLNLQLQAKNNDFENQEAMLLEMVRELDIKEQLVTQLQAQLEANTHLSSSSSKGGEIEKKLEEIKEENRQLKQSKKELSLEKAKAVKEHMLKANESKKELKAKEDLIQELQAQIPKAETEDKDSILWRLNEQLSEEVEAMKKQQADPRQLNLLKDELGYQTQLVASLQAQLTEVEEQNELKFKELNNQIAAIKEEHQRELQESTDAAIEQISDLERKIEEAESELSKSKQSEQGRDLTIVSEEMKKHQRQHSQELQSVRGEKEELLKQTLLIKKVHSQEFNQLKLEKEEVSRLHKIAEDALSELKQREENLKSELQSKDQQAQEISDSCMKQIQEFEDRVAELQGGLDKQASDHASAMQMKEGSLIDLQKLVQQGTQKLKDAHSIELEQIQQKNLEHVEQLKRKAQSQQEQVEALKQEAEQLMSQHQTTQLELDSKSQITEKLHRQLKQLLEDQASKNKTTSEQQLSKSKVIELENEIQELESKLLEAKQETSSMLVSQQQIIRGKESQIAALRQEHSEVVSAHASQMLSIQSALQEREENLRKIVSENLSQTNTLKQEIQTITQNSQETQDKHKEVIKNSSDKIQTHSENLQNLTAELSKANSEIIKLQSLIKDNEQSHRNELDEMTQTCMNQISEMEAKLDLHQEELATCTEKIEQQLEKIAELEEQLKKAEQETSESLALVDEREHQHGLMVEQIDSLEAEVEQLHQALDTLQKDKLNVDSMLESTKKEGQTKDSGVQEMVIKLSMQNAMQNAAKDRQIAAQEKKIAEWDQKVQFLNQEIQELQRQVNSKQEELAQESETGKQLRKESRLLQGQFDEQSKVVVVKDAEISELQKQLAIKQDELAQETAQCQQLRKESRQLQGQFDQQLKQIMANGIELKTFKSKAANADAMKEMMAMLQTELQAKEKEVEQVKQDAKKAQEAETKKHNDTVVKLSNQIAQIMMSQHK